jgi:uncharacterized protein (TIGR02270 family)
VSTLARPSVEIVVAQHAEDAASLRETRSVLLRAQHIKLHRLRRLDDRLAAALDGVAVAAGRGRELCWAALDRPTPGGVFAATVNAIESRDNDSLTKLMAIAQSLPEVRRGLVSAFGWVSPTALRGITAPLLQSADAFWREVGLSACSLHGVDPGAVLASELSGGKRSARALRVAAQLGRIDLLPAVLACLRAPEPEVEMAAAHTGVLLGDRGMALEALANIAQTPHPNRTEAIHLLLKVFDADGAHALLKALAQDPGQLRVLVRATGIAGDPHHVPWLIKQMGEPKLARLAGESFSLITGIDLADNDLDQAPPQHSAFGPTDNPADANVALDEDSDLPWPDPTKVLDWWQTHGASYKPGTRHFVGAPPSVSHALTVLNTGRQRQRMAAAEYLSLIRAGTRLFNTAAPAWRQERLLAQMSA